MNILFLRTVLLLGLGTLLMFPSAHAEETVRDKGLVPFDTIGEAMGVDFQLGLARWDESKQRQYRSLDELAAAAFNAMVVGPLYGEKRQPPEDHALKPPTELLAAKKVRRATLFARNYQQIGAFGGSRQEGVHVLEFEESLGKTAVALMDCLKQMGGEEKTIAGQQVIVCEWHFEKEPYLSKAAWEALVVQLPDAELKTLVYATSPAAFEAYLQTGPKKLIEQVKKQHTPASRPGIGAWVARLNTDDKTTDDGPEPDVTLLMAWSEHEKMSTCDMLFYPAVKDAQELLKRHPMLDTVINPLPGDQLKSVKGGTQLELKLPTPKERSPKKWSEEEERAQTYKMGISLFVGNLLLNRNRAP